MAQTSQPETFLFAGNSIFIEELHARYLDNPTNVSPDWQQFFASMGLESAHVPSWSAEQSAVIGQADPEAVSEAKPGKGKPAAPSGDVNPELVQDTVRALQMIHAYRVRGHLLAKLDPLGLDPQEPHPELDPKSYGFLEADYGKEILLNGTLGMDKATVGEIIQMLRDTYCQHIGVEFMHIQHPEQKQWIQEKIEQSRAKPTYEKSKKHSILKYLIEVEAFEEFLQTKYPGMKRFSIQGGD